MKGIDCTAQITPTIAQELVNQGIMYVARYLVPDWPNMQWKRFTREEAQVMTDHGIKMLSVFEIADGDTKGGAESGSNHGQLAYHEAKTIGQPEGTPIFFTVDYDAQPKDFDAIEAYLRAAKDQLQGYKVGVYGSYFVMEEMAKRKAADCFWQTSAWSRGNLSEIGRDVYQYQYGIQIAGIETDINDFYFDHICWNYNTQEDTQVDTPKETPIYTAQPYVVDLCGQGINMQFFPDHLEVRMGNGPWKVIPFDN